MRVARYMGNGEISIVEEPRPGCASGGLLVRTEACGLCSGELMSWYMDKKIPHVLGHEVCGIVEESEADEFPVGSRVFPHHHAPCLKCEFCATGRFVHCAQWKRTKLVPGGMADFFAVGAENLTDTHMLSDFRAKDAALVEPLACVCKAMKLTFGAFGPDSVERCAVIGLGGMGLLHMLCLPRTTVGYDLDPSRQNWCTGLGLIGKHPSEVERADVVFVCPGSQAAFDFALSILEPGGTIVCFAPLGPGQALAVPQSAYFSDVKIVNSYSCGPDDVAKAIELLRSGAVRAEQVCSHFIELDELPIYYRLMKSGEILKPMVVW